MSIDTVEEAVTGREDWGAGHVLRERFGFDAVVNLRGGFQAWRVATK